MTIVNLKANIDPSYYRLLSAQDRGRIAETFEARRPSVAERLAAGKALREQVPRTSHAIYETSPSRPDPIGILEKQAVERIARLIPVRYARMLASPFAFLRGSAAVMVDDLSRTPITGLSVAACGDMHVANFGVYASASATWSSPSTISTRSIPGRGSGISSAWRRAPPSSRASWAATRPRPPRRRRRACRAIAGGCAAMPR